MIRLGLKLIFLLFLGATVLAFLIKWIDMICKL